MVILPFSDSIKSQSSLRASTSRPNVGSSKNNTFGEEINAMAEQRGIRQPVLIEINCAAEEAKSGFLPKDAPFVIDEFERFAHLNLRGIMTMGPSGVEKCVLRKYFRETYQIFIDNFAKKTHNIRETVLSMGMSDSFDLAIEEGATMVRVGSAIFGVRTYL